jgi:membrane protein DedA with SNARE-associated domain
MLFSIIRVYAGCLLMYIIGWVSNRNISDGYRVPKIVALICGQSKPLISLGGLITQWISVGYAFGAVYAFYRKRIDWVLYSGVVGVILAYILLGIIWVVWAVLRKVKLK